MSGAPPSGARLDEALAALERDLLAEGGPRISTMRNYNFAIVPYPPAAEFRLRRKVRELAGRLRAAGWGVLAISLQHLFLQRVRSLGPEALTSLEAREKRLWTKAPERGLGHLVEKLAPLLEGPAGIAADVVREIGEFADSRESGESRSVVLIGRAGALYPFFRSSALLKHIDGRTRNLPVVLLYPGERRGNSALSFMGELQPDGDYRPRIYP